MAERHANNESVGIVEDCCGQNPLECTQSKFSITLASVRVRVKRTLRVFFVFPSDRNPVTLGPCKCGGEDTVGNFGGHDENKAPPGQGANLVNGVSKMRPSVQNRVNNDGMIGHR